VVCSRHGGRLLLAPELLAPRYVEPPGSYFCYVEYCAWRLSQLARYACLMSSMAYISVNPSMLKFLALLVRLLGTSWYRACGRSSSSGSRQSGLPDRIVCGQPVR
jgi:hypothetical protein